MSQTQESVDQCFQLQRLRRRLDQPFLHLTVFAWKTRFHIVKQLPKVGVSVRRRVPTVDSVSLFEPLDKVNGFLNVRHN